MVYDDGVMTHTAYMHVPLYHNQSILAFFAYRANQPHYIVNRLLYSISFLFISENFDLLFEMN
ncbi:hypothetical protein M153_3810001083 [Pseudoloma neurophilia]|uniref:Uncharacterized protein n=1 Tax=Pseudoloma neurophilia TaxID=146866 RepID=A0A0R0LXN9_9MICR|nr:hypothetical protein M153_3810001083 [Pseudoloma neurophilia]